MTSVLDTLRVPEHILKLRPYHPGKPIADVQREHGLTDIIKLASNENPLGPSPLAIRAMQQACLTVDRYPDDASYDLRHALSERLGVEPGMLIFGNGSDEIIHYLGLTFLQEGDELVQAAPTFSRYEAAATLANVRTISVPLRDHRHDLDRMADAFSDRTRLVFICNPNNPTGTINTRAEIDRLLLRLPPNALVVFDEAYCEYVENPDYPNSLEYIREGRNAIALRTFSKIYALAGLRIGYGVAPLAITRFLNQVREPFNVNSLAQSGALASLNDTEQVTRSRRVNREGMAILQAASEALGLSYIRSEANFISIDTRSAAREVCAGLERQGVIVRSLESFGMPTYIRVTVGTAPECHRFIEAFRAVLSQLG